jgi:hypothetical protein
MNSVEKVLELLRAESIQPIVDQYAISWMDDKVEHYIQLKNIDCQDAHIAWFQSSEKDQHLLRVFVDESNFDWQPITFNPYFGCDCYLLEWIIDTLVFIYKEKHDTYICTIRDKEVDTINFHGNQLSRVDNIILFTVYGNEEEVKRIQLPNLTELSTLTRTEADALGLLPTMIIGSELKRK